MDTNAFGNDGIDRADPNFITASLLVMSPGNELYSSMGHSCFRLECPKFNLDYCFSYESESAKGRMLSLLSGRLKMGMFEAPTSEYLSKCRESGRGIMQYRLNLPSETKQRLWKYLEEKINEDEVFREENRQIFDEEDFVPEGEYEDIYEGNCMVFLDAFNDPRFHRVAEGEEACFIY